MDQRNQKPFFPIFLRSKNGKNKFSRTHFQFNFCLRVLVYFRPDISARQWIKHGVMRQGPSLNALYTFMCKETLDLSLSGVPASLDSGRDNRPTVYSCFRCEVSLDESPVPAKRILKLLRFWIKKPGQPSYWTVSIAPVRGLIQ